MKGKKLIIPISIGALLISPIFINTEKANAGTGMCTYQTVFFYNEAYDTSHTGTGTTINNTSWVDSTGTSANGTNASYEVRDMTAQDCVNYIKGEGEKSAAGYGNGDAFISSGGANFNTGSYETGRSEEDQMVDFITGLGGGSVERGCETFTNNTIKPGNIEIKDNGINAETGKNQDQITRDIDYDSGKAMVLPNGKEFKFSAQTVIKTWTAPCEKEEEKPKEECSCSGGGGGGGSMTSCGGTHTNSISKCASGTVPGDPRPNNPCVAQPTISWSVKVNITETITVSVNINPRTIYAGGGVGVNISHSSSTSSSIGGICTSTNAQEPTCPSGYTYSNKTCKKEVEECSTDQTTGEKTCTTKTKTTAYSCTAAGMTGSEKARAEAAAKAAAAEIGGGGSSPKEIYIYARQSNDEKDSTEYNLSTDVAGQGIAMSTSKNGKATPDGLVGDEDEDSNSSKVNGKYVQAKTKCTKISKGNRIERLITSGSCNSDETFTGYECDTKGFEDSANKYYTNVKQACINKTSGKIRYTTMGSDCESDETDGGYKCFIPNTYTNTSNESTKSNSMGTANGMKTSVNQACINRKTSKVRYITSGSCSEDEVDGGHKYYIPLKDPSGKFYFIIKSDNVSTMTSTTLNSKCSVNVQQKLYGDDGTYKFIYRPIDLLTDPQLTVFPNRNPASNWVNLKNTQNASRTGDYDLLMKRDKTEYTATLDTASLLNIKNINDSNKNYASLDTISNSGRSNLIDDLGVTRSTNTVYNKLGECNRKKTTSIGGVTTDNSTSIVDGTECW